MRAALARPGWTYESYRRALPGVALVCTAEALGCDETAQWVRRRGPTVGVRSGSQLMQALSAGIEVSRMVVYADGAQWAPLRCGARAGVREFVLDSVQQVAILEHCARRREQVLVDVAATDVEQAVAAVCASDRVDLVGLHCQLEDGPVAPHRWAAGGLRPDGPDGGDPAPPRDHHVSAERGRRAGHRARSSGRGARRSHRGRLRQMALPSAGSDADT